MHGERPIVAARLTQLIGRPDAIVTPDDRWMPRGLPILKPDQTWDVTRTQEAKLDQPNDLITATESKAVSEWWLPNTRNANTQNLDIASTCKVSGKDGVLLVEAKAHAKELAEAERGKELKINASDDSFANHLQIGRAISDAAARLQRATGLPCSISRDQRYQMSNRFALASKLTELGYAVVLVYLGFLNAREMAQGALLTSEEHWLKLVTRHSAVLFPDEVWNTEWNLNGQPFVPLVRSLEWSFES